MLFKLKIMKKFIFALIHGIIPAILLTLPIGSVYAFSLFCKEIVDYTKNLTR